MQFPFLEVVGPDILLVVEFDSVPSSRAYVRKPSECSVKFSRSSAKNAKLDSGSATFESVAAFLGNSQSTMSIVLGLVAFYPVLSFEG